MCFSHKLVPRFPDPRLKPRRVHVLLFYTRVMQQQRSSRVQPVQAFPIQAVPVQAQPVHDNVYHNMAVPDTRQNIPPPVTPATPVVPGELLAPLADFMQTTLTSVLNEHLVPYQHRVNELTGLLNAATARIDSLEIENILLREKVKKLTEDCEHASQTAAYNTRHVFDMGKAANNRIDIYIKEARQTVHRELQAVIQQQLQVVQTSRVRLTTSVNDLKADSQNTIRDYSVCKFVVGLLLMSNPELREKTEDGGYKGWVDHLIRTIQKIETHEEAMDFEPPVPL